MLLTLCHIVGSSAWKCTIFALKSCRSSLQPWKLYACPQSHPTVGLYYYYNFFLWRDSLLPLLVFVAFASPSQLLQPLFFMNYLTMRTYPKDENRQVWSINWLGYFISFLLIFFWHKEHLYLFPHGALLTNYLLHLFDCTYIIDTN